MEPSVDRAGRLTKITIETRDAPLARNARGWAARATWTPRPGCTNGASGLVDVTFFAPWSGARSSNSFAVNFDALHYGRGPCEGSNPSEFAPRVERV